MALSQTKVLSLSMALPSALGSVLAILQDHNNDAQVTKLDTSNDYDKEGERQLGMQAGTKLKVV